MQMNFRFVSGVGAWKFKKKLRQELFGTMKYIESTPSTSSLHAETAAGPLQVEK
jgi:hypothetical protein